MNHFVQIIEAGLAEQIRSQLEADGFRMGAAPYATFEAIGSDVRVTFYPKKGKLLIQGAGTAGLLTRLSDLLGAPPPPADDADAEVREPTIGSDESGKGDYFGSLVVAGCLVRPADLDWLTRLGVRDSKTASDALIQRAAARIEERLPVAVVELEPSEYGRLHQETGNVNKILGAAHARVISELLAGSKCRRAVVDRFGGEHLVRDALGATASGLELVQIPRAEKNPAVAAASFVARDRFIRSLARLSDEVGVDLLPGASAAVEGRARKVFMVGGRELLAKVAKMHFKTTDRVVS